MSSTGQGKEHFQPIEASVGEGLGKDCWEGSPAAALNL
jgi:hypothetical protein